MEDRFKFRFFDKKENFLIDENTDPDKCIKLYDKDEWWWCAEHGLTTVLDYFDHCSYIQSRDFVIMQCTGLKDRNGKLIYEGDIVERDHVQGKKRGVVVFDKEALQFRATNMSLYSFKHRSVVIGNIYETPELLESN